MGRKGKRGDHGGLTPSPSNKKARLIAKNKFQTGDEVVIKRRGESAIKFGWIHHDDETGAMSLVSCPPGSVVENKECLQLDNQDHATKLERYVSVNDLDVGSIVFLQDNQVDGQFITIEFASIVHVHENDIFIQSHSSGSQLTVTLDKLALVPMAYMKYKITDISSLDS